MSEITRAEINDLLSRADDLDRRLESEDMEDDDCIEEAPDLLDELRAALRSLTTWRRIESAPRDGTPILLSVSDEDGQHLPRIGWWDQSRARWQIDCTWNGGRLLLDASIRGWAPLVPGPAPEVET